MEPTPETKQLRHRRLGLRLALLACAMFGFGYLLVPLYYALCAITGFGTQAFAAAAPPVPLPVDASRQVTVVFIASVNESAPWEFRPAVASVVVHPGEITEAKFYARNLTDRKLVAQAVPSIAPGEGAKHLHKLECFCFKTQVFAPNEGRDLLVRFYLDPALPGYVDQVALSYTLFDTHQVASGEERKPRS
jgi:cytochrome c oxidase assembly protein subunit 11